MNFEGILLTGSRLRLSQFGPHFVVVSRSVFVSPTQNLEWLNVHFEIALVAKEHTVRPYANGLQVPQGEFTRDALFLGYFLYMHAQHKSPREICFLFEVEQFIITRTQQ